MATIAFDVDDTLIVPYIVETKGVLVANGENKPNLETVV